MRQVDAPEHDAGIGRRRSQRDLDALAAVQADADGVGEGFEGSLFKHEVILPVLRLTGSRPGRRVPFLCLPKEMEPKEKAAAVRAASRFLALLRFLGSEPQVSGEHGLFSSETQ